MSGYERFLRAVFNQPRLTGAAAAVLATAAGLAFMAATGAPPAYPMVNAAALAIGLALLALLPGGAWPGFTVLVAGLGLLATALLGHGIEGFTRWVHVGPVSLQPALVLLPAMLIGYQRQPDRSGTLGLAVAALALALQPDRAMAATLAAGLLAITLTSRSRMAVLALGTALAAMLVTLARPDTLAPTAFVEQVLPGAFAVSPLAGLALLAASAGLLVPALAMRGAGQVFAAVWLTMQLASVFGNYPTPLIGFGGSGILGYLLALAALPPAARDRRTVAAGPRQRARGRSGDAFVLPA